jgi:molybdopterin-guanine dinucleotide biosynthesis protein A
MTKRTAVILAGGQSTRMKRDKGLVEFNGKAMIQHALDLVFDFDKVLMSSNTNTYMPYLPKLAITFKDQTYEGVGPLGGIHTALSNYVDDWALFIPVDMPCLSRAVLTSICEAYNGKITIAICCGKEQPLVGIYPKSCLSKLDHFIASGRRSVKEFLSNQEVTYVEFPSNLAQQFLNINTPQDLLKLSTCE